MSKGKKIFLLFGGFIICLLAAGALFLTSMESDSVTLNAPVEIVNGESTKEFYETTLNISKTGKFYFDIKFWPEEDPGFITGLLILGPDGEQVNAATGNKLWWNGPDMKLEKGSYTFRFYILENNEEYIGFVKKYIPDAEKIECNFEGFTDGTWDMEYAVSLARSQKSSLTAILIVGILFGIVMGLVAVTMFNTDKKVKAVYDERQQIARYKSGFYGFVVMLALLAGWGLLDIAEVYIPAENSAISLSIVSIGIMVMVGVGIWNDGYFAMNQNKRGLKIFFGIFGISQLVLGIVAMLRGAIVENGILTFRVWTFELGLVLTFLVVISMIKDSKDAEEEEE